MLIVYGFLACSLLTVLIYLKYCSQDRKNVWIKRILSDHVFQSMKKLYSLQEADERSREFCERKLKLCLIILCAGCLTAFFYELSVLNIHELKAENLIERKSYGEGDKQIWLLASTKEADWQERVQVLIEERKYTSMEIAELAKKAENDLVREIIGDNASLNYVTQNLKLRTSLDGYPFQIRWKSNMPLLLSKSGQLDEERLKQTENAEEGVLVMLSAEFIYEDFHSIQEFGVRVYPKEASIEERFSEQLRAAITAAGTRTQTEEFQELPLQIGERQIVFREVKKQEAVCFLFLGLAAGTAVYFRKDQELRKQEQNRDKEILRDYPQIINKYALYYSAGMATKGIWQKICTDYQRELSRTGRKHYVYEEMVAANESMQDGFGELSAYEAFAARCQLPRYRLFVSLLEQSLQKGRDNMCILLEKEAQEAFIERKNQAKMLGEEAGTKLLLPMFLMLFVVLFMIIVPAFFSFQM